MVLSMVCFVGGVLVASAAIFWSRRRRTPAAPYAPTLDEIMETDRRLRMIGGLDERAPPKKAPAQVDASSKGAGDS